jgi:hypothetical protein
MTPPVKTVDRSEARIWAALESETPIQLVTFDEANEPGCDGNHESRVSEGEGGGLRGSYGTSHSTLQHEVIKRKYKCLLLFAASLVVVSVGLGVFLGVKGKDSPSSPPKTTATLMDEFRSQLPSYSLELAKANASSPQAMALAWLERDSEYELYRLIQRYALGVLYYSTNIQFWNASLGWLTNISECAWEGLGDSDLVGFCSNCTDLGSEICDETSHLLALVFVGDAGGELLELSGSIPRELELLTDLRKLGVHGVVSGSIYSELYVSLDVCQVLSFLHFLGF